MSSPARLLFVAAVLGGVLVVGAVVNRGCDSAADREAEPQAITAPPPEAAHAASLDNGPRRARFHRERSSGAASSGSLEESVPPLSDTMLRRMGIDVVHLSLRDAADRVHHLEAVASTPGPHLVTRASVRLLDPDLATLPEPQLRIETIEGGEHPSIRAVRHSSSSHVESEDLHFHPTTIYQVVRVTAFRLEFAAPVSQYGESVYVVLNSRPRVHVKVRPVVGGLHWEYYENEPNRLRLTATVFAGRPDGMRATVEWEDGSLVVMEDQKWTVGDQALADFAREHDTILAEDVKVDIVFAGSRVPYRATMSVQSLSGDMARTEVLLR
jgi:hypothetical protein